MRESLRREKTPHARGLNQTTPNRMAPKARGPQQKVRVVPVQEELVQEVRQAELLLPGA